MLHDLETSWWFGCMPKDIEAFCKLTEYGVQVIASLNLLLYTPDNVIGIGTFALKEQPRDSLGFWSFFILKFFSDLDVAIFRKCFYSLQVITANKSFHILNETLDSHVECYSSTLVCSSLFMIPSYVKSNDSILGCSNVNDFPINDTVTVSLEQLEASIFVVATFSL
jgi:hypothetical protein